EAEGKAAADVEAERLRAQNEEAARLAAHQQKAREALQRANSEELSIARLAMGGNNRLSARQHIEAILARDPNNAEAVQISSEWHLSNACPDCGRVMTIGETTVKQAQSAYPALFGAAAGA